MFMNIMAIIGVWTVISIVACTIDELLKRRKKSKDIKNIDLEFKGFESK